VTLLDTVSAIDEPPPMAPVRRVRDMAIVRGWAVGVLVYVTAAFHRSSLGVAGLDAAERFGISTGALSAFVVLHLGVYAVMQVPTGLLVDRFGPRRLLIAAATIMGVAQLIFSAASTFPTALAARALLGLGDSLTFISLLRFISNHFRPRRFPLLIGITGTIGAMGAIVATVPLDAALASLGWTPSFAAAALVSLAAAVGVWLLMPTTPPALITRRSTPVRASVRATWSQSGTRLGFWVHFSTMSFTSILAVLWGQPYLVAQGFTRSQASAVLTMSVTVSIIGSPLIGAVIARRPASRVPIALAVSFATVGGWTALLVGFDGRPPHGLLVAAVVATAIGGPTSSIGFSLARDYNVGPTVGTASGVVNVGGFTATITAALIAGRILDLVGSDEVEAFRLAFGASLAIVAFGSLQALRWYLRLRGEVLAAQQRGEAVPVPAVRRRWDRATAPAA